MSARRLEARVSGRVQGVGFRYFVAREARRLGLVGWVRNTPDGAVELTAEGAEAALQELVDRCHDGPPSATVRGIQVSWWPAQGGFDDFRIRG
jgi:acylphosphatase